MRKILSVGIGAGDPEQITIQAIRVLEESDVIFVIDKGDRAKELTDLRIEILERYVPSHHRLVTIEDPQRDRTADAYSEAVETWRRRRADAWGAAIEAELPDGATGAFLVWGDPSLYDSTIAILDDIIQRGRLVFEHEVIPGVSSIHALTARHRIPLNRVARPVQITTGRRLAGGFPEGVDDVVVMLDADCAFKRFVGEQMEIYWGAYLGTEEEILISGTVADVASEIETTRAQARERNGWIMDTYLLRRRLDDALG